MLCVETTSKSTWASCYFVLLCTIPAKVTFTSPISFFLSTMIRSNPTAIPLRASDLKHLQSELEKRKSLTTNATSAQTQLPATGMTGGKPSGQVHGRSATSVEPVDGAAETRRERAARSVAERIGL